MAVYKAPINDMKFLLNDVFAADKMWQSIESLNHVDSATVEAILEEMAKFSANVLLPLNRSGDEEGATIADGRVSTPAGFVDAFKQYAQGGWVGLGASEEYGGQGMPKMVTMMAEEMIFSTNPSFCLYPNLTTGACLSLMSYGSEEQKNQYLPRMYSGEWSGTMCLTEPHAGTDLGIIKTKAIPQDNGTYKISGTKIFITGGDHDLTDNIIHLVLAKTPNSPEGSRGISLFIVPKVLINADGSLGERNTLGPGSIEHKMGIKASATCVMNFDGAEGYLVGKENEGLAAMFVMMNYERLTMGLQGLGASEIAYQNAVAYAKDRVQGRSATGIKAADKAADPIIVHPDVRRMLLSARCQNEASRCFALYVARQLDLAKYTDGDSAKAAADRVALLTPIAKAFITDMALQACIDAQQVFGGHGYIREWGMEQYVRDVRIAQIYEGTNGVQAQDLMGRKIVKNGGKYLQDYLSEIKGFVAAMSTELTFLADAIQRGITSIEQATISVIAASAQNQDEINAAAVDYQHALGLLSYAYMFALMADTAVKSNHACKQDKCDLARFYVERKLPELFARVEMLKAGAVSVMRFDESFFAV